MGRTHRYFTGKPLWPFGFGLSYTTFSMTSVARRTGVLGAGGSTALSVEVRNTGTRDGDQVVQVYARAVNVTLSRPPDRLPLRSLVGFQRVHLHAEGRNETVAFEIQEAALALVDKDGNLVLAPGHYELIVTDGADQHFTHPVVVEGKERVLEPFPKRSSARA